MMGAFGISEFTYSFSFLFEQTRANWGNLKAVPILPSLIDEGNEISENSGWDACLQLKTGIDFYYQFKISNYLSYPTASYFHEGPGDGPYYRIKLPNKGEYLQHRALRKLAQRKLNTYYVAPKFPPKLYTSDQVEKINFLNRIFLHRQVTEYSRLIPISQCRDIEGDDAKKKQHHIIYRSGHRAALKSESTDYIDKVISGKQMKEFYESHKREWIEINDKFIINLFYDISEIIEKTYNPQNVLKMNNGKNKFELLEFDPSTANKKDTILRLSQILMVFFDSVLVLAGSSV